MRVRRLRPDDGDAVLAMRRVAFGGQREPDPDWACDQSSWAGLVADEAGEPVGFARFWRLRQFFGGAAVPMGAVGGMVVRPHACGAGVASALLAAAVDRMHEERLCVSALYPSVSELYRSRGWEQVGVVERFDLPLAGLRRHAEPRARPVTAADAPGVLAAYQGLAREVDGMVDRSCPGYDLGDLLGVAVADVVAGESGVTGYLLADRPPGDLLLVHELVAAEPATAHALLGVLAGWSGVLDRVSLGGLDPVVHGVLLALPHRHQVLASPWMLRVIDLPAAIAARGWPTASMLRPGAVDIEVDDKDAPWQHGRFRLVHEDGTVRCEPGGRGAVRLTARGLAAWYAGALGTATLRRGGLLDGDAEAAARLDALTGAPRRLWLMDVF